MSVLPLTFNITAVNLFLFINKKTIPKNSLILQMAPVAGLEPAT